ncbi:MAG TPA: dihydrodipicolinate synthase family protein [Solirubrobacteraceae bacterium]
MSDNSQMPVPEGIVVPLHTPFDAHGDVDHDGVQAEVTRAESLGVEWLLIGGVTGEWPSLALAERQALLESACAARNVAHVLAHATALETKQTVALLDHAQAVGADAVMISAPVVSAVSERDAVEHIRTTANATRLPVVIYNGAPGTRPLSPAAIAQLSQVRHIVGIKDSVRDPRAFAEARALAPTLRLLCGEGDLLPAWLALGADGGIVIPALVDGARTLALYDAHRSGDVEGARRLWHELWPLIAALGEGDRFLAMTKLAVAAQGRPAGPCRPPLPRAVAPEARHGLEQVLAGLALLPDEVATVTS